MTLRSLSILVPTNAIYPRLLYIVLVRFFVSSSLWEQVYTPQIANSEEWSGTLEHKAGIQTPRYMHVYTHTHDIDVLVTKTSLLCCSFKTLPYRRNRKWEVSLELSSGCLLLSVAQLRQGHVPDKSAVLRSGKQQAWVPRQAASLKVQADPKSSASLRQTREYLWGEAALIPGNPS